MINNNISNIFLFFNFSFGYFTNIVFWNEILKLLDWSTIYATPCWQLKVYITTKNVINFQAALAGLHNYLKKEYKNFFGLDLIEPWKQITVRNIPYQTNGWDCGVFLCKYAENLARGVKFDFSQEQMSSYRISIKKCILKNKLEDM